MGANVRLALVANGPPEAEQTNSGVAAGILSALRAHPHVADVLPIDASLRGPAKALAAVRSIDPSESGWRAKYAEGALSVRLRSELVRRQLGNHSGDVDLTLVVRGVYEPFPFPYAMFIDSTVALTAKGWPPLALDSKAHRRSLAQDQAQLSSAVHVFTAAQTVADHVIRDYGLPADRVTAIGGGLNYPLGAVPEWAPALEPTILFVGHDFERKGGDVLLRAFRNVRDAIPDARLVLVGRGTQSREGQAHLRDNPPGVQVLGEVDDRRELSELYRTATVFCLPSRFEPFGLVLLEAMAHGLPCVASRVGGMPEILHNGDLGLLVDPGDVDGLARALIALLHDRTHRAVLSERGRREVAADRTWDRVAKRLMEGLPRFTSGPSAYGVRGTAVQAASKAR